MSLLSYYPLDIGTYSGTNIANNVTGTGVYDASLNGGASISASKYRSGSGALSLDVSGQYVKMNSSLITTSAGLTFSFWARANNGCGINTLLDYSNGAGGNQKITYGLLNNSPYAQVINGTSIGTVSILTDTFSKSHTGTIVGLAFSANHQIMVLGAVNGVYFSTYSNGTWSAFTTVISANYSNGNDVAITSDGYRIVWVGSNYCYYATWSNASQNFIGITQTLDVTARIYSTLGMTGDGSRIVTSVTNGYVYTANWTGANYTAFTQISDSNARGYNGIALTLDGNRLFLGAIVGTNNLLYSSVWNTTTGNYDATVLAATVVSSNNNWIRRVKCSPDGNVVFISSYGASANIPKIACYTYNGTSYTAQTPYVYGSSVDLWGMTVVVDGSSNYIYLGNNTAITRFRYTVSNQYTATNFYTTQNLNDNQWIHHAWVIDTPNTRYKYYINGSLIKTDTSANYAFPAATTRTKNLLGTSTDLSMSYFTGGIDQYRVYSGVLTDAQINSLYTADAYNSQSLIQNYTFDVPSYSGTNLGNYVSGSYVYDASLNGGATISTSNLKVGTGALALDVSGRYVRLNNALTTSNSGLSFSFWARANNGVGQYTLLDYSNGAGGNNKISMGIQSNTIYTQVTSASSVGTLSFTTPANVTDLSGSGTTGICMTNDGKRFLIANYDGGTIKTFVYSGSTWTLYNTLAGQTSVTGVCCTNDGNRIVFTRRESGVYFATWNSGTSTYTVQTSAISSLLKTVSPSMTPDGGILLFSDGQLATTGRVKYSFWTGSDYTTPVDVSNCVTGNYMGTDITQDGSRIAYVRTDTGVVYTGYWNGSIYVQNTAPVGTMTNSNQVRFSPDGNILFVLISAATNSFYYSIYNGTTYGPLINSGQAFTITDTYGLVVGYDNSIYASTYTTPGTNSYIQKATFTASASYLKTNFYTAQNLNDNTWRHYAWTINPATYTYKYYLNGALINTDTSANYAFPALTTRTNNLLGTSTDLSMSYFTGGIDQYRVYNGVLTDAQITALYQPTTTVQTTPTQQIQYYTFESSTVSGTSITNGSTNLYDASLNGGATISTTTTKYKVGTGALSLDVSGQHVRLNNTLTTTSTGLSFLFWARANNGVGINTLLDYSNGPGGNQKITYGLLNNSPYAQVVNGTTVGTVSILTDSFSKSHTGNIQGLAFSANHQIMVLSASNGVYFSTYSNGTWSAFTTVISATYTTCSDVAITSDGTKIVWIVYGSNCYYATWSNASQNFIGITQTLNVTARNYRALGMTGDGSRIVTATGGVSGSGYTANWTGANYTAFTQISDSNVRNYNAIALTLDGSRLFLGAVAGTDNLLYYSVWNSTTGNYAATALAATVVTGNNDWIRRVKCSPDGNVVFISSYGASANIPKIACYTYNGTSYIAQTPYVYGSAVDLWGMTVVVDGSSNYIYLGNNTAITRFRYTASNQYTATNFYTTQNLNDNQWRQYAWTIDPSNTTYKYYLNGSLIKTDTSATYAFPAPTARTNNLLGTSTDLSMSYFTGGIDQYRAYTGVLTDTQIYNLFKADAYNNRPLIQYYTFEPATASGNNVASSLITGANVYDASLNGGATISTTSYKIGTGALAMDVSGRYVRMNSVLTTSNSGLSFAFWARANNGVGQYTLLDYSNGSGGNNKISMGLQSNTIYTHVTSASSMGTVSFTTPANVVDLSGSGTHGMCMTNDGKRFLIADHNNGTIKTYTYSGSSWSLYNTLSGLAVSGPTGVCCTNDGNRIVYTVRGVGVYFATWNGSSYTVAIPAISSVTNTDSPAMTPDGGILLFSTGVTGTANTVKYSFWTGSAYTTSVDVSNCIAGTYFGTDITQDGSRIAYVNYISGVVYSGYWNGSIYVQNTATLGTIANAYQVRFSPDGNILFVLLGATTNNLYYSIYNGTNYGALTYSGINFTTIGAGAAAGLVVGYDNSIYAGGYTASGTNAYIQKATFTASASYLKTNFYTAQNLNDNTWRHYAWTIDPSNTTYKYYINGALINTDTSANYAFPAPTTRTNNLLGTSTDLSLSYFIGGIDQYRVYNGVLTDAQVLALSVETQMEGALTTLYPLDTTAYSGTNVANNATGTYVYDASLNGGATISTTNYKVAVGSLSLDASGQNLKINSLLNTPTGVSFLFWMRASNGTGQTTVLDYASGPGGNNKITYGLQNNQIYTQVTNGTTVGTLAFTTAQTTTCTANAAAIAYSPTTNRFVYATTTGALYMRTGGFTGSDTLLFSGYTGAENLCITSDGTRLLWSVQAGDVYYASWNGTTYVTPRAVNTGSATVQGMDVTDDGNLLVIVSGNVFGGTSGTPSWAYWTGTGYSAYKPVLYTGVGDFVSCAITPDGSRITYLEYTTNQLYYAIWNGSNYVVERNALYFYGGTSGLVVNTNTSYDFATGTIECWMKTSGYVVGALQGILVKRRNFSLFLYGNVLGCYDWDINAGAGMMFSGTTVINDGKWHHIALVYINDNATTGSQLYVDGKPDGARFKKAISTVTTNSIYFGSEQGVSPFYGYIDEIRLWNTALSDADILKNYNTRLSIPTTGLVGYWPMDEGTGTTVKEQVSGNQTLTVATGVAWIPRDIMTIPAGCRNMKMSKDGNILFLSYPGTTNALQYLVWDGTAYGTTTNTTTVLDSMIQGWGLWVDYNNSIYTVDYDVSSSTTSTLYKTTFQASNQYTATHFYSQENLNNSVWRQCAWTIDPYNSTYKYYVNGTLVQTDASTNYVFPAVAYRNSNRLGVSTDLSLSYFKGKLDYYRVYNGVLTDTQVLTAYKSEMSSFQPWMQHYTMDTNATEQIQNGYFTTAPINLVKNGNFDSPDITIAFDPNIAIDNWTKSTTNIGIRDLNIEGYTKVGLPTTITQIAFLYQPTTDVRSLTQSITFPTAGNYALTFYTADRTTSSVNTFQASIGSTVLQTITYPATDVWYKYVIPFSVSSGQLTQTLTFQTVYNGTLNSIQCFTGVSIVSMNYTNWTLTNNVSLTDATQSPNGQALPTYVPTGLTKFLNFQVGINANYTTQNPTASQPVSFPNAGNYTLTFWNSPYPGNESYFCPESAFVVYLDGITLKTVTHSSMTEPLLNYQANVYVSAPSTKTLMFELQSVSNASNTPTTRTYNSALLCGVSIVSADTTTKLANYATGTCSYDASLNGGATISATQYKTGAGAFNMDTRGQTATLPPFITTSAGLSIALWFRGSNGVGQNTLLDYSNGLGGNNRISLGLQNNTLLSNVVNGSGIGTLSFSAAQTGTTASTLFGITYSDSANRLVYALYTTGILYFRTGMTGSDTQALQGYTYPNINSVFVTNDGTRLFWSVRAGNSYYATWNGTNYVNPVVINAGASGIQSIEASEDGNIIVVSIGNISTPVGVSGVPKWAYWNGSQYSTFQDVLNASSGDYSGCTVSPDGSEVAFVNNTTGNVYYAVWNGSGYTTAGQIGTVTSTAWKLKFSKDGNILFATSTTNNKLWYFVWNGTTNSYGSSNTSDVFNAATTPSALWIDYGNNIYVGDYSNGTIYKTTFQVSNQYTQTNFYTAQNLNDNQWRHVAWTMDPVNYTYRYYINGALIETDTSTIFPAETTRTNNLLGTSTDLPLSYFTGGMDNYRVYNGVLTPAQIGAMYTAEANTSTNNLLSYYPLDALSYVESSVANYVTGTYVYDGTLVGGCAISSNSKPVAGVSALSLDVSGQYVKMNSSLTTTSAGLSFSFWARGNNGVGTNTLLDYSNGSGGNQKITFGIQNGNPYAQVVNGTGLGALSFTNVVPDASIAGGIDGFCMTADGKRLTYSNAGVLTTLIFTTSWNLSGTYTGVAGTMCCTADGSRLVVISGSNAQYLTWNGINYSNPVTITLSLSASSVEMTADGRVLVITSGTGIYYSFWSSITNNYTTFIKATTTSVTWYHASITSDGSRIAYTPFNATTLYYLKWNNVSQTYDSESQLTGVGWRRSAFSRDGNIIFIFNGANTIQYAIWDGSSYTNLTTTPSVFHAVDLNGASISWDNSIYYGRWGDFYIRKNTFQVSNQYTATNFYTAQNLNDNKWRHYAWTINPATYTYKYYINGSLVKTDTSATYAFPAATTRTNNLLGTSTDLSLSYFTGGINQYRVHNGVLTDAQVYSLYTADAYNSQSLIQNYSFDTASQSGNNLGNYASNAYYVYDASLNGGATITTTNYKTGVSFDATGQHVRLNNNFTTGAGLSFAFWARGNNGVGQYTLLDYSNGSGGNQKIMLGLQNNQLYSQVVNGTGIGTVSFTTPTTSSGTANITGLAYYQAADRFVWSNYVSGYLYFRTGMSGTDTVINSTAYINVGNVCMTNDGNRIAWNIGMCYFATWTGSNYTGIQTVNAETGTRSFQQIDMTEDGSILVASISPGKPVWSRWNGVNYSAYQDTLITSDNYRGISITPDGSRIAYSTSGTSIYYSVWNGTNYSERTLIGNVATPNTYGYKVKFSKDGNVLFVNPVSGNTGGLFYCVWNGSSFGAIQSSNILTSTVLYINGMALDYDNNLYFSDVYTLARFYKTKFQVANQYTASNFYSAQNLNDNQWRQYAWTIDPSNTTYKYYLNGTLVKTDTSATYAFPGLTTRTNNLLGVSTDLSLSYFTGGIDNYRVYNGVLTDAQVYSLYTADAYNSQSLIQYYSFDTTSQSGNNIASLTTGSNVYDASLNGGATISTTSYKIGTGALAMDVSGRYVRMNNGLTTGTGLSFAFWARANNGVGQYTLLDYSTGAGGKNKITLGIQSNTIYTQVTSASSVGTLSFTTPANVTDISGSGSYGMCMTNDGKRILVVDINNGTIKTYTYSGSSWSLFNTLAGQTSVTGVCCTNDGNRIVFTRRDAGVYFATWNSGTSTYTVQSAISSFLKTVSPSMTPDGGILLFADGQITTTGTVKYSFWTGSAYTTPVDVSNCVAGNYMGNDITQDGSRIAYVRTDTGVVYSGYWNGSIYVQNTATIGTIASANEVRFSPDGNILFVLLGTATNNFYYSIYNGTTYGPITNSGVNYTITLNSYNGLVVGYDNSVYACGYTASGTNANIQKLSFTASASYLKSNFYPTQNLNDNVWRHYAWTINPATYTYKYYLNGSLIKTDTSANYAFPGLTTRTNNLLGTSTDLSMSYFTGGIDQYRVYNGVLADADVLTLFNADNYNTQQQLIQYYTCEPASLTGVNLANSTYGSYVYDASLNGGATISTTNYPMGTGALSLDATGQYVRINNSLTTGAGLTFAFWARANNGVGQYTLLDYSNGPGGNNKITYSIQNNQPYAQVVNGTGIGTVSFTTPTTSSTASVVTGVAYYQTADRLVWSNYTTGYLYYRTGLSGTDTVINSTAYPLAVDVCMTNDGNRIAWTSRTGLCRFATWTGSNYTGIQIVNADAIARSFQSVDMTEDGSILVASIGTVGGGIAGEVSGIPVWARWNGVNYSDYTNILNVTTGNYTGISISPDGSRIAYATKGTSIYYAVWDGTNYSGQILIGNVATPNIYSTKVKFSKDGNVLFINPNSGSSGGLFYSVWNGTSFGAIQSSNILTSTVLYIYGMALDYDNNLYFSNNGNNTIYKTKFQVSNQYTQTNFSTQNLNDNIWRHYAWTINPTTYTYKYYINGALIKTDTSANYAFPAPTTRTNNLLGVSTDLSMSYFTGGIDQYRVYSGVLTDTEILNLFKADKYPNGTSSDLLQYYSCDSNKWTVQPALSTNYNLVHQYTFDYHTVQECFVTNTAYSSPVYDCRLSSTSTAPVIDTVDYKTGTSSVYFSAITTYLQIAGITVPTSGLSITCWYKYTSGTLFDFSNDGNDNISFSPVTGATVKLGATSYTIAGGTATTGTTWRHFAWTMSSAGVHNIYMDGALSATTTSVYPNKFPRINNYIGKGVGRVDDFRVYQGVLSLADIQKLYSYVNSVISNNTLLNYYTFDYANIQNGFIPNQATNELMYDCVMRTASTPFVDVSNNRLGTGCLSLSSNNQYVQIKQTTVTNSGMTIAVWVKITTQPTGANWARIMDFGNATNGNYDNFGLYMSTTDYGAFVFVGTTGNVYIINSTPFADGNWHHLVYTMTYSASNTSQHVMYVDGTQTYTTSAGAYPRTGIRNNNRLGASVLSNDFMTGLLDDYRLYNGVMAASDVAALYASTQYDKVVKIPNLVKHYTFEPAITTGNYAANVSSTGLLDYDLLLGPSAVPTMDIRGLRLDGSQKQYVLLNNISVPSSVGFSVAGWFRYSSNNGSVLFDFGDGPGSNQICYSPVGGVIYYVGAASQTSGTVATGKADGTWHHFAWTMVYAASGNTTHNIYIDSAKTTYATWLYPTVGQKTYNYIGKSLTSSNDYATGWVDDFRVYSGVLTDTDVSGIYVNPAYSTSIQPTNYYTFAPTGLLSSVPTGCVGLYACKWVNTNYTGPIFQLRANTDAVNTSAKDFWINSAGTVVGDTLNGRGTSLASWLSSKGATTAYVVTWYDQSGTANHATQATIASQPTFIVFNTSYYAVNFPTASNPYLNASPTTLASGNNPYMVTVKTADMSGASTGGFIFECGTSALNQQVQVTLSTTTISNHFSSNGFTYTGTIGSNKVFTCSYDKTNRYIYYDKPTTASATLATTNLNLTTNYTTIGANPNIGIFPLNGSLSFMSIFNNCVETTRNTMENVA